MKNMTNNSREVNMYMSHSIGGRREAGVKKVEAAQGVQLWVVVGREKVINVRPKSLWKVFGWDNNRERRVEDRQQKPLRMCERDRLSYQPQTYCCLTQTTQESENVCGNILRTPYHHSASCQFLESRWKPHHMPYDSITRHSKHKRCISFVADTVWVNMDWLSS